ncbi:MAG: DEAD/DEAH box helicase family protein [Leptospiraceae bacterium]|nr:DEAD/DEAH box helicase family protein [Leptospiraceae bacterium]
MAFDKSIKEPDSIIHNTQDLGIPVSTDVEHITNWFKKHKKSDGIKLIFTTYQSGKVLSESARAAKYSFDLGIFDEAHKTVGVKEKAFSHLLYEKNISIQKRLFMTATERRYVGQSDEIVSMDNIDLYGDPFQTLSFKEAIEEKPPILCDYFITTIAVLKSEIKQLIESNIFVKPDRGNWDDEIESRELTNIVALRKAVEKFPIKHAVSFHGSIAKAKLYLENQELYQTAFPKAKKMDCFHVTGEMSSNQRSKVLNEFQASKLSLVTNARCLTEGVDVPNIDCILFADPKRSTVDIVQAVGRVLRTSPGKERGYIIIPVLVDDANPNSLLEDTAFQDILMTLRALASNDERIIEYFRSVSKGGKRKRGGTDFPVDIAVNLPLRIDLEEFRQAIELKCWSRLAKLSWMPFEEAREFARSLGLGSGKDWRKYYKGELINKGIKPEDIPRNPNIVYKNHGWVSMGDWLGSGFIATQSREYLPFQEARKFVHNLKLKSMAEWLKYCKGEFLEKGFKPDDIPQKPNRTYKNEGWIDFGDWLGTGNVAPQNIKYRPFQEARRFVHKLKLKNREEWKKYFLGQLPEKGNKPDDIPRNPNIVYKDQGWISIGDWLGSGTIANYLKVYIPFEEAREFVRKLGLKNEDEWRKYCKGKIPKKGALNLMIFQEQRM